LKPIAVCTSPTRTKRLPRDAFDAELRRFPFGRSRHRRYPTIRVGSRLCRAVANFTASPSFGKRERSGYVELLR
jgi:hypothetical protein